ncbi:MAG: DUF4384 domain-containing protein [Planctomycetaceae bacterium]|nr:DUF4384 domain-containing protein [Planctomycetaceae bacterium]
MKTLRLFFVTLLFTSPIWAEELPLDFDASLIPLSIKQSEDNFVLWGRADKEPWAGYSFPLDKGGLEQSLTVYDKYAEKNAEKWEKQHRKAPTTYSSAWAASSILESEPTGKNSKIVKIRKGLLAGIYDSDKTIKLEGGNKTTNKCTPKSFWQALRNNINRYKKPIIVCFDGVNENDNYAIYSYNITATPTKDKEIWEGEFVLLGISDIENSAENPKRKLTLKFHAKIKDSTFVDDGEWVIKEKSPSYVWVASSPGNNIRNEQINVPEVRKILALNDEELAQYLPVSISSDKDDEKIAEHGQLPKKDDSDFVIVPPDKDKTQSKTPKTTSEPPKHDLKKAMYLSVDEMLALLSNKISSWNFDASIPQKHDGGVINIGEKFRVSVKSEKPGYVYIIAVNSESDISMIYPMPGENNYYSGNQPVLFPRDGRQFQFSETLPIGAVRLKVFLTGLPVHISGAENFEKILLRKSNDQEEQNTTAIFGDDDEIVSTCFLTRRLRMMFRQRRYVQKCVRYYPDHGQVIPPTADYDEQQPEQQPEPPIFEPQPITPAVEPEPSTPTVEEPPITPPTVEPQPIPPVEEPKPEPTPEEPKPEPLPEKPQPEPATEEPDLKSSPEESQQTPSTDDSSEEQADAFIDEFLTKQPKKPSKPKRELIPPKQKGNNDGYFDIINQNMRKLLNGFAQDEVLIINAGKAK